MSWRLGLLLGSNPQKGSICFRGWNFDFVFLGLG